MHVEVELSCFLPAIDWILQLPEMSFTVKIIRLWLIGMDGSVFLWSPVAVTLLSWVLQSRCWYNSLGVFFLLGVGHLLQHWWNRCPNRDFTLLYEECKWLPITFVGHELNLSVIPQWQPNRKCDGGKYLQPTPGFIWFQIFFVIISFFLVFVLVFYSTYDFQNLLKCCRNFTEIFLTFSKI